MKHTPEEYKKKKEYEALYKKIGKDRARVRKNKRCTKRRDNWKSKYSGICPRCGRSKYGDDCW